MATPATAPPPASGNAMSRDDMMKFLTDMGVDATMIPPDVPDACLQSIVSAWQNEESGEPPEGMAEPDKKRMADMYSSMAKKYATACTKYGGSDAPTGKALISSLEDRDDVDDPEALGDWIKQMKYGHAEVQRYADMFAAAAKKMVEPATLTTTDPDPHKMDEPAPDPYPVQSSEPPPRNPNMATTTAPTAPPPKTVTRTEKHEFSEAQINKTINDAITAGLKAVVEPRVKALEAQLTMAQGNIQKFHEDAKLARVEAFVAANRNRIMPNEVDTTSPLGTIIDDLMRCDDKRPVHKFSEGGKEVLLTDLERAFKKIEARPAHKFGERIGTGDGKAPSQEAEEVKKLETHYESFAEDFYSCGVNKEEFVGAYKAARKRNPKLTAEAHLVSAQPGKRQE